MPLAGLHLLAAKQAQFLSGPLPLVCSMGDGRSRRVPTTNHTASAMVPIKVRLLADSTGTFGKETGDSLVSIFGNRQLKRFSIVVEDGIVKSLNVELEGVGLACRLAPNIISQP
uniref:Uncharacterized protein n=1 Tax=Ailuropoda melanoleuca TaxID=9646 RepID=A0A7N5P5S8_AILME